MSEFKITEQYSLMATPRMDSTHRPTHSVATAMGAYHAISSPVTSAMGD